MSASHPHLRRLINALELGNWQSARQHGENCLANGDDAPSIYGALALANAHLGDAAEALRLSATARRGAPEDPSILCQVAEVEFICGHIKEAEATLAVVCRIDPVNVRCLFLLCNTAIRREDKDALAQRINALAALGPDPASMSIFSGELALLQGNQYAAEAHFRDALRHQPENFNAHLNLAILFFTLGHAKEALPHAATAATIRPNSRLARKMTEVLQRFDNRFLRSWFSISVFLKTGPGLITGLLVIGLIAMGTLGSPRMTLLTIVMCAIFIGYARWYARKMLDTVNRDELQVELSSDY